MSLARSQRQMARELLEAQGIMRLGEFTRAGVTAATVSRMERDGEVVRLARGLYQLPDVDLDAHHCLAEAAKRYPKGVVCLISALAFHDITDQVPNRVWLAIGRTDWTPRASDTSVGVLRFSDDHLARDVETRVGGDESASARLASAVSFDAPVILRVRWSVSRNGSWLVAARRSTTAPPDLVSRGASCVPDAVPDGGSCRTRTYNPLIKSVVRGLSLIG